MWDVVSAEYGVLGKYDSTINYKLQGGSFRLQSGLVLNKMWWFDQPLTKEMHRAVHERMPGNWDYTREYRSFSPVFLTREDHHPSLHRQWISIQMERSTTVHVVLYMRGG